MPYVFVAVLVVLLGIFAIRAPRARAADRSARPTPHAMCYKPAAPRTTVDFVCPKDGSRTQYPVHGATAARLRDLEWLQGRARALATPEVAARATIVLDLSELCRTCTPQAPEDPLPVLAVTLPNGKQTRTRGVTADDLILLREFFAGSTKHRSEAGKTTPLAKSLPRIRQLLGMPEATIAKPRR